MDEVEGLSKREQIKLQRFIQNDSENKNKEEEGKGHTHAKSYKRKGGRRKQCDEGARGKHMDNDDGGNSEQSEMGESYHEEKNKKQNSNKKPMRLMKPYNPKFAIEGGEEFLPGYMMIYAFSEKEKQIEKPEEDLTFLESLEGSPLEMIKIRETEEIRKQTAKQFEEIKEKIEAPFDEVHRSFTQKFKIFK